MKTIYGNTYSDRQIAMIWHFKHFLQFSAMSVIMGMKLGRGRRSGEGEWEWEEKLEVGDNRCKSRMMTI